MIMLTEQQYAEIVGNVAAVQTAAGIEAVAASLVRRAAALGLVLTVEQRPLQPLAMGHHETVVAVRPARVPA